ncbi:tyrosine-type recombinase/integrase [Micromonospora noduli]|uniref:tyrosine-type recombinase/integrase n=1 Tax=Micromonospora noduli TaxID=709876 RepID=UPI000DD9D850|nr:site-specific integrase [Micromonospora noduli]
MSRGSPFKSCSCRDKNKNKIGAACPRLRRACGAWSATHGTWAYRIELPTPPDGKRWQLRRFGFATREAALVDRGRAQSLLELAGDDTTIGNDIARMLKDTKSGRPFPDRDSVVRRVRAGFVASAAMTLGDYLWQWHASRRKIQPTTLVIYESHIRVHLVPHLGHIPIDRLRVGHLQSMFDSISDRNLQIDIARRSDDVQVRASVRGVRRTGPATMQRIRATLRKALNDAIRTHRLIEFNPAAYVELPSVQAPRARVWTSAAIQQWKKTGLRPSSVMVWTPEQAGAFLDHVEDHDVFVYPIIALILHRGLRRGEALGLRESDVDLTGRTVTINQQLTTLGYRPVIKIVKSHAGDRIIALDASTTTALRIHQERRQADAAGPKTGLFFVRPDGHQWHPEQFSDRFEQLVAGSGLPPIRLHDLRHCAATFLKASGSDLKDIQEVLGLSSITVAANTYTSVVHELESERAKAEAAAALVPRRSGAVGGTSGRHPQQNDSGGPPGTRTPNLWIKSPQGAFVSNLKRRSHLGKRGLGSSTVYRRCLLGVRVLATCRYVERENSRFQLRRATAQLAETPRARAYGGAPSRGSLPRARSACRARMRIELQKQRAAYAELARAPGGRVTLLRSGIVSDTGR